MALGKAGRPATVSIVQSDEVVLGLLRAIAEELQRQTQMLARIAFGGGPPPTLAEAKALGLSPPGINSDTSASRRPVARGPNGRGKPN